MNTVYIVTGETGEYSDWRTWLVRAFEHEVDAKEWARLCQMRSEELRKSTCAKCDNKWSYCWCNDKPQNGYDGEMAVDYTGVTYDVKAVQFGL